VEISADFVTRYFRVLDASEAGQINIFGENDGLVVAQWGGEEGPYCYLQKVSMKLQFLEKFNESPFACKVIAVLETSPDDPLTATKVLIAMDGDGITDDHKTFTDVIKDLRKAKQSDGKHLFKSILEAMLDLRLRLPPIYKMSGKNFMVHPVDGNAKVILTEDMFVQSSKVDGLERDELLYKSPEELLGEGKSLTTPFWVFGCLLYELKYGLNPFRTHLKP